MPFLNRTDDVGPPPTQVWSVKRDVDLCQMARPEGNMVFPGIRIRGKVQFRILDSFGHVETLRLLENGSYSAPPEDRRVVAGETTDLASIPGVLWGLISSYGDHTLPALLHDTLCAKAEDATDGSGRRLRREADTLFRRMLKDEASVGIATRWLMWSAVRLFATKSVGLLALLTAVMLGLLATADWLPGYDQQTYAKPALVASALLLAEALRMSVENDRPRLRSVAGMLGASVIGVIAVTPLSPMIVLTFLTWVCLRVLDGLLWLLHAALIRPIVGLMGVFSDAADEASTQVTDRTKAESLKRIATEPNPLGGIPFPKR